MVNKKDINEILERTRRHDIVEYEESEDGSKKSGIVIAINEADDIKMEAQIAMRMAVEKGLGLYKFILITNNERKIDQGLAKRLAKFEFRNLKEDQAFILMHRVMEKNNVSIPEEDMKKIYEKTQNPRDIIMELQKSYNRGLVRELRQRDKNTP